MSIAILGWGSLCWDPRDLAITGEWIFDGPMLPVEFARISGGNRITLVIKNGFEPVNTLYVISSLQDLNEARENLRRREGTENMGNIGFVDFTTNTQNVRGINAFVLDIIRAWNTTKGFDAVIWSDFAPNFSNISQQRFLVENLISFLDALPENEKIGAIEYIKRAPKQVKTRYRAALEDHFSQGMEQL